MLLCWVPGREGASKLRTAQVTGVSLLFMVDTQTALEFMLTKQLKVGP